MTRKGKSHSRRPMSKRAPEWCRYSPGEVEAFVIKLAKEENHPSRIGVILRDQYGIPLVKPIVGKSIKKIIEDGGLDIAVPEDLNNLIKKASALRSHLKRNRADAVNKSSLVLIISKIRRLAKYYRERGILPKDWKYKPATPSA